MPDNLLFEYAVIRVVPHVEREEFINVGVILYCSARKFLQTRFVLNESRLKSLCETIDVEELRSYILSFERICAGGEDAGPIGKLTLPERFRWLTASRSTILQTSPVHPGLCTEPGEMLEKLFEKMVC
jgi:hypothetical protein